MNIQDLLEEEKLDEKVLVILGTVLERKGNICRISCWRTVAETGIIRSQEKLLNPGSVLGILAALGGKDLGLATLPVCGGKIRSVGGRTLEEEDLKEVGKWGR